MGCSCKSPWRSLASLEKGVASLKKGARWIRHSTSLNLVTHADTRNACIPSQTWKRAILSSMAPVFRCSSHDDRRKSLTTRDRERREESEKLTTLYLPARTPDEEPVIPKPEIFDALHNPTENPAALPTIAECAVHLELLEKFVALKQKVLTSNRLDRAFAIIPKDKIVTERGKRNIQADQTFKERQAVKWPIFVLFAAARFLRWWRICSPILHTQDNKLRMAETSLAPLGK